MELVLNLAWLLLAIPAYWLWRGSRIAFAARRPSSRQCLLALGCMLAILFPVVSATDDLHAMRTEMEESPLSKRSLRQASHDKSWTSKSLNPPAWLRNSISTMARDQSRLPLAVPFLLVPIVPAVEPAGRAPPASPIG
jgi:hypothetical protein